MRCDATGSCSAIRRKYSVDEPSRSMAATASRNTRAARWAFCMGPRMPWRISRPRARAASWASVSSGGAAHPRNLLDPRPPAAGSPVADREANHSTRIGVAPPVDQGRGCLPELVGLGAPSLFLPLGFGLYIMDRADRQRCRRGWGGHASRGGGGAHGRPGLSGSQRRGGPDCGRGLGGSRVCRITRERRGTRVAGLGVMAVDAVGKAAQGCRARCRG